MVQDGFLLEPHRLHSHAIIEAVPKAQKARAQESDTEGPTVQAKDSKNTENRINKAVHVLRTETCQACWPPRFRLGLAVHVPKRRLTRLLPGKKAKQEYGEKHCDTIRRNWPRC
jgi:hypothetical protein